MLENEETDTTEIDKKLKEARKTNENAALVKQFKIYQKEHEEAKANSDKKETEILEFRNKRSQLLKGETPIDNLEITEEGLIYKGLPFKRGDISTSEEMEVGLKILMLKNINSKIFTISRGESLGTEKLNSILDFAKK